jgi:hypothetical protein
MSEEETTEEVTSPFAPAEGEPLPDVHQRTVTMIAYAPEDADYESSRAFLADVTDDDSWFTQAEQVMSSHTYLQLGDGRIELSALSPETTTDLRKLTRDYSRDDVAVIESEEMGNDFVMSVERNAQPVLTDLVTELLPEQLEINNGDDTVGLHRDDALTGMFLVESGERMVSVQAYEPDLQPVLLPVDERTTPEVFRFDEAHNEQRLDLEGQPRYGFTVEINLGWTTAEAITDLTTDVALPLQEQLENIDSLDLVRLDYVQTLNESEGI